MSRFSDCSIDEATLAAACSGQRDAHEQIYRAYSPAVYTLAQRILQHREAAEEVLQDTFVEVLDKIGSFRGAAPLGAWIRRIAVNKALSQLRSGWHRYSRSLDGLAEVAAPAASENGIDIANALATLAPVARAVIWLHDVEGYTHREIGELMDKTPSFSKSQLARAHRRLREQSQYSEDPIKCMPILNNC